MPNAEQPRTIEKMAIPDSRSGSQAHNEMPLPLGQPAVEHAQQRNQGTQDGVRNYFLNKLATERETGQGGSATSADPVIKDQGQPPAYPPQPAEVRQDDIQQPVAEPPAAAEQPPEHAQQQDSEALPGDDESSQVDAQEQLAEQLPDGLEIDGKSYTAEEIKSLIEEANNGGLRLDDYKRKTQYLSRVRQEHEALGTHLSEGVQSVEAKEEIINRVLQQNLAAYENVDTSRLTPEAFQEFKNQYAQARRGADLLRAEFDKAENSLKTVRQQADQAKASSTLEMLRWHEPRWDHENTFYAKVRDFAVNEGLVSTEEFDGENDFLRMVGLIAMMDRHDLPSVITEQIENPKPPAPQRNAQRPRNDNGRFTTNVTNTQNAVLQSGNAKGDGSLRNHFMARLERERQNKGR